MRQHKQYEALQTDIEPPNQFKKYSGIKSLVTDFNNLKKGIKRTIIFLLTIVCLLMIKFYFIEDHSMHSNRYGFMVGDPNGKVQIEFFLDFQCSDSKKSYFNWLQLRKSYSLQQNKIKLIYQFNPLPFEFYSTLINAAFFYLLNNQNPSETEKFMTYMFQNQPKFSQQTNLNKTMRQFIQEFSEQIGYIFHLNPKALAKELVVGSEFFKLVQENWKYSTKENGVSGTPIFYANGVRVDGAQDYDSKDWSKFIKQYKSTHGHLLRTTRSS